MIISASRRTDIAAFYSRWFMNRVRAGYCTVPNPVNLNQVSRVSLRPEDVDVIVFWTRNAAPLLQHLPELDRRGFRYYFLYTLMDNRGGIDGSSPPPGVAIRAMRRLAEVVSPDRLIWRYDPILFTGQMDAAYHAAAFSRLAAELTGSTRRCMVSIVRRYAKLRGRLELLARNGHEVVDTPPGGRAELDELLSDMARAARQAGIDILSCAEERDLTHLGIRPGKCIDDLYMERIFGLTRVSHTKDPGQRAACGCVVSRDIGMYDTCTFGCVYCYATTSLDQARRAHEDHDPESPSLAGRYERPDAGTASPPAGRLPLDEPS